MENNEAVRTAIKEERCYFGTVDTWIIWVCLCVCVCACVHSCVCMWVCTHTICILTQNLTGGRSSDVHVTDVTNASRTMLMNIHTLQWDPDLCE